MRFLYVYVLDFNCPGRRYAGVINEMAKETILSENTRLKVKTDFHKLKCKRGFICEQNEWAIYGAAIRNNGKAIDDLIRAP